MCIRITWFVYTIDLIDIKLFQMDIDGKYYLLESVSDDYLHYNLFRYILHKTLIKFFHNVILLS